MATHKSVIVRALSATRKSPTRRTTIDVKELTKLLKALDEKHHPVYLSSNEGVHPAIGVSLTQDPLGFTKVLIHTKNRK